MSRASASGSGGGSWMSHLPFILLGLRSSVRVDFGCSPANLLYGGPLRLPGDMFGHSSSASPSPSTFADNLLSLMLRAAPMPVVYHGTAPTHIDPRLRDASHVFLRVDSVRRPLTPPYEGPFLVQSRSAKTFDLWRNNKTVTVSVDRLKPALSLPTSDYVGQSPPAVSPVPEPAVVPVTASSSAAVQRAPSSASSVPGPLDPSEWPLPTPAGPHVPRLLQTRSGRISRRPVLFGT